MVNESVYGARNTWITLTSGSTVKFANFGDNDATIRKGFSTEKLKPNKPYNNSIVHSALGNESAISRMRTFKGAEELSADNFDQLQWSFACGTTIFNPVDSTSTNNSMHMLAPITNSYITNAVIYPVLTYAYNSMRAVIRVKAQENKTGGRAIDNSLSVYCRDNSAAYPYITSIYLDVYEKKNSAWSRMTTYGYLGYLIHNVTTYFSNIHATGKTFQSGIIGDVVGAKYGSQANVPEIIIGGLLSQRLADGRLWRSDIALVSGDFDVETDVDGRGHFYIEYYGGFKEYCMHQAACFGIQFVTDSQYATVDIEDPEITDEELNSVYIGVLDESYIGHGDFVNGERIFDTEQYDKDAEQIEYDPNIESADFGDLETDFHILTGGNGGHTVYNMTENNLALLVKWAHSEDSGDTGQNYFDYITSVKFCPFGFTKRGDDETVKINGHLVNVDTTAVKGSKGYRADGYSCEPFTINRYFNDFRDFEPYTQISLKLPFADTIQLPTTEWYGHNLRVSYTVDEMTGTGIARVYRDGLVWLTVNCVVAIDVPLTVLNAGSYHNALIQAKTQRNSALIGIGMSAVSMGANISAGNYVGATLSGGGLVNAVDSFKQSDYNLHHITKPVAHVGGTGDITNYTASWYPQIVIERPYKFNYESKDSPFVLDNAAYSETIGHACLKCDTLNKFTGFTVCADVNLSINGFNATAEEKATIENYLKSGVIL